MTAPARPDLDAIVRYVDRLGALERPKVLALVAWVEALETIVSKITRQANHDVLVGMYDRNELDGRDDL